MSPVGFGDVFSYELGDGRHIYLRAVEIDGDDRDNHPRVELLDWTAHEAPLDAATLPARASRPPFPDLLSLVRYPRDPDPAERITILATATPVTRRRTLPAEMVAWTNLENALARNFGI